MDINNVIDYMLNEESKRASDSATRGTVKMRVFLKFARLLGISLQSLYDTQNLVRIDPSLSRAIEILWNGGSPIEVDSLNQNWTVLCDEGKSSDDEELLQKFLARDFAKPVDISKMILALEKRFAGSNGDHFRRQLGYVFAADGLLDTEPNRFERYSDHLAVAKTLGEPIDDDSDEDPMETHVRAVRTIYRDVMYATPERIGATLRLLLKVDRDDNALPPKRRGDGRSSASSESSDDDDSADDSDGEDQHYDKYIADQYKKLVGKQMNLVIRWLRERLLRRKEEEAENFRKRTIATKRKLTAASPNEKQETNSKIIKTMPKNPQPEEKVAESETIVLNNKPKKSVTKTMPKNSKPEEETVAGSEIITLNNKSKKSVTFEDSEKVITSVALTPAIVQKPKKKKKTKKPEEAEADVKKRKKSEKSSKKTKKAKKEILNTHDNKEEMEVEKQTAPTETVPTETAQTALAEDEQIAPAEMETAPAETETAPAETGTVECDKESDSGSESSSKERDE